MSASARARLYAFGAGSGLAMVLAGAYMIGGLAGDAQVEAQVRGLKGAAAAGFSEDTLDAAAGRMEAGSLAVARRHDPLADSYEDARQAAFGESLVARAARHGVVSDDLRLALGVQPAGPAGRAVAQARAQEFDCLTDAVYFEARGESPLGQAAVAQVVLNRVKNRAFPKTVCGVVFQRVGPTCAFSFACDGSMNGRRDRGAMIRAEQVASRALDGFVVAEVGQATHFHTLTAAPAWGPNLLQVAQVGLHVFYRFTRPATANAAEAPAVAAVQAAVGVAQDAAKPTEAVVVVAPVTPASGPVAQAGPATETAKHAVPVAS